VHKVGLLQRGGYSRHIFDFHFSIYSKYHGKYLQGFPQCLHLPTATGSENFCISTVEVNVANTRGPSEWNGLSQLLLVGEFKRVGGEYTVGAPVSRDYVSAFVSASAAHRLHLGTPVASSINGVESNSSAQTFAITFENAMAMMHKDAKQGDQYVFAVTVLSADHGTDLLSPIAYLDSPSFQLLENASPTGQMTDAVAELLDEYEIQREAKQQAEAAAVQTLLSGDVNRALLTSALPRASLHSTMKLDLVVEDLLGWVRDDTTRACCDRPWYSSRGNIVQDPTAALVRNVLGSSVLEQVLTCISRHNDVLEGNLTAPCDESSAAENGSIGAEQAASRGTSDPTGSATEGDASTTGNDCAPAEWAPIPVELPFPTHNKMHSVTGLTAVLKHTSEATLHLARRLSKRRANNVSPEFAFFFSLLPDVKRVHRDLVRPFLSADMPELPALKRATSYLRASYSWSLEGPGASGVSDDIASTVPQPSEGQTDKEIATTADSLSSEHDESGGIPRAEQDGETRGLAVRAIKAEFTLRPPPRKMPPSGESKQESLLSFDNFKAIAQDSGCASLELLSLLADRVCSGDHARAHAERLRGLHVRRALARKAQEGEAAERASVELAAKLSADRAALRIHTGRNKIDGQPTDEPKRKKDVDKNGKEGKRADVKPTAAVDRDADRVTGKRGRDRTEVSKHSKAHHTAEGAEQESTARTKRRATSKRKRVRGLDVTQLHDLVRLGQMLPSAEQEEGMDVVASSDEGYSSSEEASSASLRSLSQEEGSDIEDAEEV
jgi:hypothetical protein